MCMIHDSSEVKCAELLVYMSQLVYTCIMEVSWRELNSINISIVKGRDATFPTFFRISSFVLKFEMTFSRVTVISTL